MNDKRYNGKNTTIRMNAGLTYQREAEAKRIDDILSQIEHKKNIPAFLDFNMTPMEIKEELDEDIIKQDLAKVHISNIIYFHYARIRRMYEKGEDEFDAFPKKNCLLIGDTGVGKSYMIRKLANMVGVPFVKFNATDFTGVGYVGNNVNDMVRSLVKEAKGNIELAQYGIVFVDEIDKIFAKDRSGGPDVSGTEVQYGLLKLMEEAEVELPHMLGLKKPKDPMQEGEENLRNVINTKYILFIFGGRFGELEKIVKGRVGYDLASDENWRNYIESKDIMDYGFTSEFVGRIPVIAPMQDLTPDDLYEILKKSRDSAYRQQQADFDSIGDEGISLTATDDALRSIAGRASMKRIGARALVNVFEKLLVEYKHKLPSTDVMELEITTEMILSPDTYLERILNSENSSMEEDFFEGEKNSEGDEEVEIGYITNEKNSEEFDMVESSEKSLDKKFEDGKE